MSRDNPEAVRLPHTTEEIDGYEQEAKRHGITPEQLRAIAQQRAKVTRRK